MILAWASPFNHLYVKNKHNRFILTSEMREVDLSNIYVWRLLV